MSIQNSDNVTISGGKIKSVSLDKIKAFNITDNNENVASIQTYLLTSNIVDTSGVVIGVNLPAFSISVLDTDEGYQGKGYASLLLIYALCYLKLNNPDVNYSILDDDSGRSESLIGNIYNSLGYVFQGNIALDITNSKKIILSGPERQLMLDTQENVQDFLRRVNKMLNKKFPDIEGGNVNRKTRKFKRTRKNKRTRKAKKSRKVRK
jgi:GNAT superfamily N-acetyltransferase